MNPTARRLTIRQRQCLDLMSQGMSSGQVAAKLGLSPHSVQRHLKLAYARLGANDRAHAVRRCFELGVFAIEPKSAEEEAV